MKWKFFLVLSVLISACSDDIPNEKIRRVALDYIRDQDCYFIPIDEQRWRYVDGETLPDASSSVQRGVRWLVSKNIIDVRYVRNFGIADGLFVVSLKPSFDGTIVRSVGSKFCIQRTDFSKLQFEITRKERVRGGKTPQWDGVVAFIKIKNIRVSDFEVTMNPSNADATPRDVEMRVLFKENPFNKEWQFVASDQFISGRFSTEQVPAGILRN